VGCGKFAGDGDLEAGAPVRCNVLFRHIAVRISYGSALRAAAWPPRH
jgi:hypothetical protein